MDRDDRSRVSQVLAELVEEVVIYPPFAAGPVEIEVAASAAKLSSSETQKAGRWEGTGFEKCDNGGCGDPH